MTKNEKSVKLIQEAADAIWAAYNHINSRLDDIGYAGVPCSPTRKKALVAARVMLSAALELVQGADFTLTK